MKWWIDDDICWWIDDDICWCRNSDECTDTKCYRHYSNRKTKGGLFTCADLKNTNLCPSYFSLDLAKEEENVSN